jgi:cysteine desulfurase
MSAMTYLDHNATSSLRPEAREAMLEALACQGNPSSIHAEGRAARALLEKARETVGETFGVKPSAVIFTSGGTEAANWLLQCWGADALAISSVEHPCILQGHRFDVQQVLVLPVGDDGRIDTAQVQQLLPSGSLVAVQAANNETGVVQPLEKVAEIAKSKGVTLICDAVQAVGRVPLGDLEKADVLFFSAHKFGGPKGVGAVVFRGADPSLQPLIGGGGQERRLRSGTENLAGIAGLGTALAAAIKDQAAFTARAKALQSKLETGLRAIASDVIIFGESAERLPNTTCFAIPGKRADMLVIAFDLNGIAISSGSACSSGKVERSHVLRAMGVPEAICDCAIRVSSGWNTQEAEMERFLTVLSKICSDRQARHAA